MLLAEETDFLCSVGPCAGRKAEQLLATAIPRFDDEWSFLPVDGPTERQSNDIVTSASLRTCSEFGEASGAMVKKRWSRRVTFPPRPLWQHSDETEFQKGCDIHGFSCEKSHNFMESMED